jgi:hypothetical protein
MAPKIGLTTFKSNKIIRLYANGLATPEEGGPTETILRIRALGEDVDALTYTVTALNGVISGTDIDISKLTIGGYEAWLTDMTGEESNRIPLVIPAVNILGEGEPHEPAR